MVKNEYVSVITIVILNARIANSDTVSAIAILPFTRNDKMRTCVNNATEVSP